MKPPLVEPKNLTMATKLLQSAESTKNTQSINSPKQQSQVKLNLDTKIGIGLMVFLLYLEAAAQLAHYMNQETENPFVLVSGVFCLFFGLFMHVLHFYIMKKASLITRLNNPSIRKSLKVFFIMVSQILIIESCLDNITRHFLLYLAHSFIVMKSEYTLPIVHKFLCELISSSYLLIRYSAIYDSCTEQYLLGFFLIIVQMINTLKGYLTLQDKRSESRQQAIISFVKEFYKDILQIMPKAVAAIDQEEQIVFKNQKIQKVLGCARNSDEDIIDRLKQLKLCGQTTQVTGNTYNTLLNRCDSAHNGLTQNMATLNVVKENSSIPLPVKLNKCGAEQAGVKPQYICMQHAKENIAKLLPSSVENSEIFLQDVIQNLLFLRDSGKKSGETLQNQAQADRKINSPQLGDLYKINRNILTVKCQDSSQQIFEAQIILAELKWNSEDGSPYTEKLLIIYLEDVTKDLQYQHIKLATQFKMRMLASLSHELRTPLNCSLMMLDILLGYPEISQSIKDELLKPIFYSNNLLLYMVNNILDYSSLNAKKLQYQYTKFNLADIVADCKNLIQIQTEGKNIKVEVEMSPDIPFLIFNDSYRIKQVLVILLLNAIKYTPSGSIKITVLPTASQKMYKITISDTGVGMTQEQIKRIQSDINVDDERFCKISIGLGLYIANKLAENLVADKSQEQNFLEIESRVQVGTSISFYVSHLTKDQVARYYSNLQQIINEDEILLKGLEDDHGAGAHKQRVSSITEEDGQSENVSSKFQETANPNPSHLPDNNQRPLAINMMGEKPKQETKYFSSNRLIPESVTRDSENILQSNDDRLRFNTLNSQPTQSYFCPSSLLAMKMGDMHNSPSGEDQASQLCASSYPDNNLASHQKALINDLIEANKAKTCQHPSILICDDEQFNLLCLSQLLKQQYYIHTFTANSGDKAIAQIKQFSEEPRNCCSDLRIIFMDIDMPFKDGFQTTKEIATYFSSLSKTRKKRVQTKIIACSSFQDQRNYEKAMLSGMVDYITKPIMKDRLNMILLKYYAQQ